MDECMRHVGCGGADRLCLVLLSAGRGLLILVGVWVGSLLTLIARAVSELVLGRLWVVDC